MPARMVFPAFCAACGAPRKFIEFKVVPCGPHAEATRREYGFRCLACKALVPEIVGADGARHRWERGQHVESPAA